MLQYSPYRGSQTHLVQVPVVQQFQQAHIPFQPQIASQYIQMSPARQQSLGVTKRLSESKNQSPNESLSDMLAAYDKKVLLLTQENKRLIEEVRIHCIEREQQRQQLTEMNQELHRLRGQESETGIIREITELRNKEFEKYRFRFNTVEAENRDLINQNMELNGKIQIMQQEVVSWKQRYQELDEDRLKQVDQTRAHLDQNKYYEIESLKKSYEKHIQELEKNLTIVSQEYGLLQSTLKEQKEELEKFKQVENSSNRVNNDIEYYKTQIVELSQQKFELERKLIKGDNDQNYNATSSEDIQRLQQELRVLSEKNKYLVQENQKLYFSNDNLVREIKLLGSRLKSGIQ